MLNKKIIISGGSGSGKDFLLRGLIKKGFGYSPKFTTRPKRIGETEGVEYNFIDKNQFNILYEKNYIKVYQKFIINGDMWFYGITKENWEKNKLFIMTPRELKQISNEDRKSCIVIYLKIDESIRRNRIAERQDNNDSIDRRIKTDYDDFENFTDYDLCITDSNFNIDELELF